MSRFAHPTVNPRRAWRPAAWLAVGLTLLTAVASAALPVPAPPRFEASAFLLQDAHSGRILAQHNPDARIEPASITKIMTVYVALHELTGGTMSLDEEVTISKKAWQMDGSRMFIEVGKRVSVNDLLRGIIIQSGNDASVALAEHVAGDEATFAELMNRHAARLGMTGTHFTNSTGMPDADHYTTARDIALMSRALIAEFPEQYAWFAEREMTFNDITQPNRNKLLWRDDSVDGIKTGYTSSSGYSLVASANRDGMRLISVVLGTDSTGARAKYSQTLLAYGFRFFETHRLYETGQPLTEVRIWKGAQEQLPLGIASDLYLTIPRGRYKQLKATLDVAAHIEAPTALGAEHGTLQVTLDEETLAEMPLIAITAVPEGSLVQKLTDSVLLWFE